MKKIFTLAAVALFMMTSCSDDDNGSTNPAAGTILPTKIVENYGDGETFVSNYYYDGTKVIKITHNDGTEEQFTYTADRLSMIKYYEDGELVEEDTFTYNSNGQLTTYLSIDLDYDWGYKTLYTYNADGTIGTAEYYGDAAAQDELNYNGVITFQNNNLTTVTGGGETITYTFDTKHDPFINATSYADIILGYQEGGVNNVLSYNASDENSTTVYEYNSSDYPTHSVETFGDGTVYTTDFYYNN